MTASSFNTVVTGVLVLLEPTHAIELDRHVILGLLIVSVSAGYLVAFISYRSRALDHMTLKKLNILCLPAFRCRQQS